MNTTGDQCGRGGGWEDLGRAAERFARRVAEDARRFAARVDDHMGELAHDLRREWHGRHTHWHGHRSPWSPEDVRRVFEDVRGILRTVLDGVDEVIGGVFHGETRAEWTRVVCNREATCGACHRTIAAGAEAHVRRTGDQPEFRCLECGAPSSV